MGKLLLVVGIMIVSISMIAGLIAFAVFYGKTKKLNAQLNSEYGEKREA